MISGDFWWFLVVSGGHARHSPYWWWNLLSRGKTFVISQTLWRTKKDSVEMWNIFKFHSFYIFSAVHLGIVSKKILFCFCLHVLFWFFLVQSNASGVWIFQKFDIFPNRLCWKAGPKRINLSSYFCPFSSALSSVFRKCKNELTFKLLDWVKPAESDPTVFNLPWDQFVKRVEICTEVAK